MKRAEEDSLLNWLDGLVIVADQAHKKCQNLFSDGQAQGIRQARDIVRSNIEQSREARRRPRALGDSAMGAEGGGS